jgi:tRNA-uridine 2-sulfurtransferase
VQTLIGNSARDGDVAWVRLETEGDRIAVAAGDGPGVAELCRSLRGLQLLEAAAVRGDELAVDALHDALGSGIRAAPAAGRVAVAMSGGVDSAVALLRAVDAGHETVGVTLRLWTDPAGPSSERACCSPQAVLAARETCHRLGLPHVTIDARREFLRAIVEPFVQGYGKGETPNPCIRCNGFFRFGRLLAFARQAGAGRLATGHYARIVRRDGRLLLAKGADADKDQSYMLARLDPRILDRLWFPLGEQTKEETRAEAARAGLAVAGRSESQEACFLGGDDYRSFLARHGLPPRDGAIEDESGRVLGSHGGFWTFTAGQRKGLGVAAGSPVYALRTVPSRNAVVVGPRESLARTRIRAAGRVFADVERAEVKLRYRSPAVPGRVERWARGFEALLDEPAFGVAAGQAAVLYDRDVVVGAGKIVSSSP